MHKHFFICTKICVNIFSEIIVVFVCFRSDFSENGLSRKFSGISKTQISWLYIVGHLSVNTTLHLIPSKFPYMCDKFPQICTSPKDYDNFTVRTLNLFKTNFLSRAGHKHILRPFRGSVVSMPCLFYGCSGRIRNAIDQWFLSPVYSMAAQGESEMPRISGFYALFILYGCSGGIWNVKDQWFLCPVYSMDVQGEY